MSDSKAPPRHVVERLKTFAAHDERLRRAAPDRDAVISEFGKGAVKDHPDGSWSATIKHDKDKIMRAEKMFRGARKEQVERGEYVKDGIPKERVKTRDGRVVDVYEHLAADQARKSGARPMTKTRGPRDYFSMADSAFRYERGPGGLYFVWSGGWEPVNLWRPASVVSPQEDPDGNVWVEDKDGWVLKEERDGSDDRDADSGTGENLRTGPGS